MTRRMERRDAQHHLVRLHRTRHEFAARKRSAVENKRSAVEKKASVAERRGVAVDRKVRRAPRNEPRNERNVGRAESGKKPVRPVENQREAAEKNGYKRVSDLVNFPKFFPGLGIIFVKPDTLPAGPFLCFDRQDRLVATVYMIPIKDIDDHKTIDAAGVTGPVDHVSFYFNPGHPGVAMPHYHFVIWHVSKKDEARVAQ
jgi:hypothetical protein